MLTTSSKDIMESTQHHLKGQSLQNWNHTVPLIIWISAYMYTVQYCNPSLSQMDRMLYFFMLDI